MSRAPGKGGSGAEVRRLCLLDGADGAVRKVDPIVWALVDGQREEVIVAK